MTTADSRFLATLLAAQQHSVGEAVAVDATQWRQVFNHGSSIDKACGPMRTSANQVRVQVPHLWDALIALSKYVTPLFPGTRTTLLGEVVPAAFAEFTEREREGDRVGAEVAFLRTLARSATQIMAVQALATTEQSDEMLIWDVWSEPLPAWLAKHDVQSFYFRPREPLLTEEIAGAQSALIARLVSHREIGLILREGGLL